MRRARNPRGRARARGTLAHLEVRVAELEELAAADVEDLADDVEDLGGEITELPGRSRAVSGEPSGRNTPVTVHDPMSLIERAMEIADDFDVNTVRVEVYSYEHHQKERYLGTFRLGGCDHPGEVIRSKWGVGRFRLKFLCRLGATGELERWSLVMDIDSEQSSAGRSSYRIKEKW